jgi:hypothetical protein
VPSLNLKVPTDRWEDSELRATMTSITVQIWNGGVYYQLLLARADLPGGGHWLDPDPGAFLGPGYWNFSESDFRELKCFGIRFKRAGATVPATVVTASGG